MNHLLKNIPIVSIAPFLFWFMSFNAFHLKSFDNINKVAVARLKNNTCISFKTDTIPVYENDAEIMGMDKSMRSCNGKDPCNCPGGYFIHIDGLADPHGKCISCTAFKALEFPGNFVPGDQPAFPIAVHMFWKFDTLSCDSSRIRIISITKK